jgi:2-oxoisovalerate dehydrogenase E1 component
MEAVVLNGNNIVEMYTQLLALAESIRQRPRPILVECMTFRMRGHEEASGTKYVPKELFEEWAQRDPVSNFEHYLLEEGSLTQALIEEIRAGFQAEIDEAINTAFPEQEPVADTAEELADMYAPVPALLREGIAVKPQTPSTELRFIDAIQQGLNLAMHEHPNLILMGQDIAEYGGAFKVTEGFVAEFGKDRVRNTPLCESAIIGAALGLSLRGYKSMVEMQFADFVSVGFNQIVNNLAKIHWRWGVNADVVVRMPTGAGVAAGPFHSQSNEAWFFHTPGLKVVYPSNPADAKGLLLASIADPNPVIFFEHKVLYRSVSGMVPEGYYTIPIGKAAVARPGGDATIVTYGAGVHWALAAADAHHKAGTANIEVLDLRTLLPWDSASVAESVTKTGKLLILHEDTLTGGIGGEIAAWVGQHCFTALDAPVMRCASLDMAIPFAPTLEANFLAKARLDSTLADLLAW